jgi:hypothetical protein
MSEIKKGNFMCWEVCTQTSCASTTTLADEEKVYFTYNKPSTPDGSFRSWPPGTSVCQGNNLKLTIETEGDGVIKQTINSYNITDSKAKTVGHGYNLCIEDWTDEDFNDIYVNLVGWAKKG